MQEAPNFWLSVIQSELPTTSYRKHPTAGMLEPKMDDCAYYYDRFSRHDVLKSGASCLWFAPDNGHFRRHDDVLKRLPCLQLKFQSFFAVGMTMVFEVHHACDWQMNWFSGFIMTDVLTITPKFFTYL